MANSRLPSPLVGEGDPKGRKGGLKKRSFSIAGHRTSVALEPEFWAALDAEAHDHDIALAALVARVDGARGDRNLASALRVHVLTVLGKGLPG